MILTIKGSFTQELGTWREAKLCDLEAKSIVQSKEQARGEFERFLRTTDLPGE